MTGQQGVKIDSSVSTKSGGWKVTSYSVEDGEITTTTTHDGVEESNKIETRGVAPPPGGACSTCLIKVGICDDIDYLCMASYISAFITVVGACGTCYASAGWVTPACGLCMNALVGGAGLKLIACGNPINCDGGEWVCTGGNPKFCNDHAGEPGVN